MTWWWVPLCWHVRWLDADMACQLCMLASWLCHDDIILIRVWHIGRVVWYSGQVSLSGWRSRVARVCARGQSPRRRVTAREDCSDVRFWRGFHQWLRLFLLYTVVWSKHNFDNFHFWAKIKHHFKPSALIPIVGDSGSPMRGPWCTDSCSKEAKHTETQYLTWFGKTAYIHGRESILFRDRERITTQYMEEEDHFTQTQLSALIAALAATACNGSKAAAIAALHFLSCSLHFSPLSSQFALLSCCLFISKNGATSSSFSSTKVAANLWHLGWVHMVGATPAATAAIVNGCSTLMATNPTIFARCHGRSKLGLLSRPTHLL